MDITPKIELINSAHLHLGQTRYIIKLRWWEQWERYADPGEAGREGGVAQSPGPIDNSDLINPATTQVSTHPPMLSRANEHTHQSSRRTTLTLL